MNELVTKTYVKTITDLHKQAAVDLRSAISNALQAGSVLQEVKENIEYGTFGEWVEKNLPFDLRTAQRYMKMHSNTEKLLELQPSSLSEAYKFLEEPKPTPTFEQIKEKVKVEAHIEDDDDEEWGDEKIIAAPRAEPSTDSMYPYWPPLKGTIEKLESVYKTLSAKRDHTTPESVGYMIGNIKEMANRLNEWNPANLFDCPRCFGSQQITEGKEVTTCPICINGKIGPYRKTEL